MKILFHSNAPWSPTGYGQQTAMFTRRFRDAGHDVAISAFWGLGGAVQEWEGMRIYPADETWGNVYLPKMADHWGDGQDCLVITLMDVWVLKEPALADLNLAAWVPVDHDPVPPEVANFFQWSQARPIAMSRFGQDRLRDLGHDPLYVPHGVDTETFKPRPGARDEVRAMLGIPDDGFVVGMVAANKDGNPSRKSYPQVFEAFSRLRKTRDDTFLYLHTEMSGRMGGPNLVELAVACNIPLEAIKHTPPWWMEMGVDPSDMACLYSAMDVLANPAHGEGFGVPIIEAQACGVPVIVNDWTAMPELRGAGWLVDGDRWWDGRQRSFFKAPSIQSVHDALDLAYEARGDVALGEQARDFAAGYDADYVMTEYWAPVLEQLTPVVSGEVVEPEVFVREPNRAERRAIAKKAA